MRKSMLLIKAKRPRLTVFENTSALYTNKKFRPVANGILNGLHSLGYVVKDKVLDSQDFGPPTVRKRWFVVGIRKDSLSRPFSFPDPVPERCQQRVTDILDAPIKTDKPGRLPSSPSGKKLCKVA